MINYYILIGIGIKIGGRDRKSGIEKTGECVLLF